jgi:integrase
MKWEHIDFKAALMTMPKEALEMDKELKVPLATQSIAILKEAHKDTGNLECESSDMPEQKFLS